MFAEDFQSVLLFMGKTMKPFFIHIGRYMAMFVLTVLVLVPGFFILLRFTGSVWGFVPLAAVVAAAHWLIRRSVILPSLARIDLLYAGSLLDQEPRKESLDNKELSNRMAEVRRSYGTLTSFRVSKAVRAAASCLYFESELLAGSPEERVKDAFGRAFTYALKGYLLFAVFLVIFLGISFLSTLGLDVPLKLLIFTLGTLFAAFLFQAVVEPIIYLLVLTRLRRHLD